MPKRTFWMITGVAVGAGSSLWVERRVRRTVQEAAARLQPDALVAEVGRSARQAAGAAGDRMRDAVSFGRDEMRVHEQQLWEDLAARGIEPPSAADSVDGPDADTAPPPVGRSRRARRGPAAPAAGAGAGTSRRRADQGRRARGRGAPASTPAKSPSHLDN